MSDGTGDAAAGPLPVRQWSRLRSRVDRFATLVEETGPGRHHHRPADDDRDLLALVELAHQLGRVRQPAVRDRFREELHDRLRAEFARHHLAGRTSTRERTHTAQNNTRSIPAARSASDERTAADERDSDLTDVETLADIKTLADVETQVVRQIRPRRGHGRLAVVIGLATGALALSGVSAASGGALPGDPLYSVKRSGEQAQLMLAGSDVARGQLHLDFARTRLIEARHVAPDEVGAVLAEMDRELIEGARLLFSAAVESGDVNQIDAVSAFVVQHRPGLLDLHASVPLPNDPALASLDLLDGVAARAEELRAAMVRGCTAMGADRYGPKPAC